MKRILLAEDEEVLRMLVVDTLEDEDYIVDEAADGGEAMELFQNHSYDLVILDYMMPIFTGLEVIEKIRNAETEGHTKILMLSAKNQSYEQEQILQTGADYFMAKPFSPMKLLELVEGILNGKIFNYFNRSLSSKVLFINRNMFSLFYHRDWGDYSIFSIKCRMNIFNSATSLKTNSKSSIIFMIKFKYEHFSHDRLHSY